MNNLSFHITDIVANSIRANASEISVYLTNNEKEILIHITDNGCGMDANTLERVTNPFYTTRNTRKVGLGLPFLRQNAEQTGGNLTITSTLGKGTEVKALFISSHIDCPPWGDLAETIVLLITGNPDVNIHFSYQSDISSFTISTQDIKDALDGMPLSHPQVTLWLKEMIGANVMS